MGVYNSLEVQDNRRSRLLGQLPLDFTPHPVAIWQLQIVQVILHSAEGEFHWDELPLTILLACWSRLNLQIRRRCRQQ
jgi:hypothetical protein